MTLTADQVKRLRALSRGRSPAELKKLFAAVRAHDDKTLLAAVTAPRKRAAKRAGDPLLRELEQTLKPILAPAAEKADLLVDHMAKKHRRKLALAPKGMADAVKQLRRSFSDEQISAAAQSLIIHLAKLYGDRETVV